MRVLVTGGSGFIGSAVVRRLLHAGHGVVCTVRPTTNQRRLAGLPVETVNADMRDHDSLRHAIRGCDAIIHAASLSHWKDLGSPDLGPIVVEGTRVILEAIAGTGIRMVYVGSAAALGACSSPNQTRTATSAFNLDPKRFRYAAFKAEATQLCLNAAARGEVEVVVVHPTETYGPGDWEGVTSSTLIEWLRGGLCLVCDGGTSVVHVDDVADGVVSALERGRSGSAYILGGDNLSIKALAETVQRVAGKKRPILTIPGFMVRMLAAVGGVLPVPALRANTVKYRYALHHWYGDNRTAREELGVSFRSAEETIRDTLKWLQSEGVV
jgi:dihydroflavonol-4-reductase